MILAAAAVMLATASCEKEPKGVATMSYQFQPTITGMSTAKMNEVIDVIRSNMKAVSSQDKGWYDKENDVLKFYDSVENLNSHNTLVRSQMMKAREVISEMDLGAGATVTVKVTVLEIASNTSYEVCEFTVVGHSSAADDLVSDICGFGVGTTPLSKIAETIEIEDEITVIPLQINGEELSSAFGKYYISCTENDATDIVSSYEGSGNNAGSLVIYAKKNGKAHLTLSLADENGNVLSTKHIVVKCHGNFAIIGILGAQTVANCGVFHDTVNGGYNFVATTDELVNLDKCKGDKAHTYFSADFPETIVGRQVDLSKDRIDSDTWAFSVAYCVLYMVTQKSSADISDGTLSCYVYTDGLVEVELNSSKLTLMMSCYPTTYNHYIWGTK